MTRKHRPHRKLLARAALALVAAWLPIQAVVVSAATEPSPFAPGPRPDPLSVRIRIVPGPGAEPPAGTPVTTGVPFAEGWLEDPENLVLRSADGRVLPAQFSVRGRWPRTGGVRWLGIDFAPIPGVRDYVLGPTTSTPPAPDAPVEVDERADVLVVRTGALRAEIPRRGGLLRRVWWRDRLVLESDEANWFTHLADGRRASDRGDPETRAEVELAGPLHTVVRVDGYYRGAPGDPVPRWTVRLHFHAGQPSIGIQHTFVWIGAAEALQIRELALGFRLARPGTRAAADRGPEPGDGAFEASLEDEGELSLLQDSHFAWGRGESRATVAAGPPGRSRRLGGGERAGAWIDVSDGRSGVALVLRDLWKQHPKELRATREQLTAFLWSSRGDSPPLDLRFEALERLLGPKLLGTLRTAGDRQTWRALRDPRRHDPTGMAKTHDLLLVFHDGDWRSGGVEAAADAFEHPPLALPDPVWSERSGVPGLVSASDPKRFPEQEARIAAVWQTVRDLVDDFGDYGFFGWGSGPHHAYDIVDGRAVAKAWRFTGGIEYGYARAAWLAWLRSGDRTLHELAAAHSRYLDDLVLCHEESRSRRRGDWLWSPGMVLVPWAGAATPPRQARAPVLGLLNSFGFSIEHTLYRWYLTGDLRSLDVARTYAAALKDAIASQPGWAEAFVSRMNTALSRHAFQRLEELAILWEQFGDPWYRREAEQLAGLLLAPDSPAGIHLEPETSGGPPLPTPAAIRYKGPNLFRYAQAVDGEARRVALASLLRLGEYALRTLDTETFSLGLRLGAAFRLSGDPLYLDFARTGLERGAVQNAREPAGARGYRHRLNGVPELAHDTIAGEAALLAALRDAPRPSGGRVPMLWKEPGLPAADVVVRKEAGRALDLELSAGGATFETPAGSPWPEEWTRARARYARKLTRLPFTWRRVRIPASAPAGDYRIHVSREGGAGVLAGDPSGLVLVAPDGLQLGGAAEPPWRFAVPRDAEAIEIRANDLRLLELHDAQGAEVAIPRGQGQARIRLPAGAPGVWSVHARRPLAFALAGVPPVFAPAPGLPFTTRAPAPARQRGGAERADPWPEGLEGRALRLTEGASLVIPPGEPLGDGRYGHYEAAEGTIELWLRPDWDAVFLPYGTVKGLFALEGDDGSLSVSYRHAATADGPPVSEIVVQAHPPGAQPIRIRAAEGDALHWTPDAWVHVALVWLPGRKGQTWALYVDGRRRAALQGAAQEWEAFVPRRLRRIRIGAVEGSRRTYSIDGVIDQVRISSVARHRPSDERGSTRFDPPRVLAMDAHTLALLALDGDLRVRGARADAMAALEDAAPMGPRPRPALSRPRQDR